MKLPYKLSRTLKRYESKHGNQVLIRIRMISGKDIEIPVYDFIDGRKFPISVKNENWYNGYAIGGEYHIPINNFNLLIDNIEKKVGSAMFILLHRKIEPTRKKILHLTYSGPKSFRKDTQQKEIDDIITNYLEGAFESEEEFLNFISNTDDPKYQDLKRELGLYEKNYILDYWDGFITEHASYSYNLSKKSLEIYIEATSDNCIVTRYDDFWLGRYFKFLASNGYYKDKDTKVSCPYAQSTLEKYLKHMRSFGDYLFGKRLITNQNYRRYKLPRYNGPELNSDIFKA